MVAAPRGREVRWFGGGYIQAWAESDRNREVKETEIRDKERERQ